MPARLTSWLLGVMLLVGLSSFAVSQDNKVAADKAIIVVKLPADATLTIDGEPTKAKGPQRRFGASGLEAGKRYAYTLVATWKQDGKEQSETQKARFRGGETVEVVFPSKKVDPPKDGDAKKKEAEKLQAAYETAMKNARAAADGKKYDEAIAAYDVALKLKAGDKAATDGKAAAVKAQAEAKKQEEEAKNKEAEAKKMQAAYDAAMKDAKAAVNGKKYKEALEAFDAALKAKPGDKAATDGKAAAVKAQGDAKKQEEEARQKEAEAKKMQAAYDDAMKNAKALLDGKKYAEAIKAFDAALRLKPGDQVASDAKAAALKAAADAKKEAAYKTSMASAKSAMKEKKYGDAIKEFDAALTAKPGDKAAAAGKNAAEAEVKKLDAKKAEETLPPPLTEKTGK